MEKKYHVLRIVANLFKVLAWVILILGLLAAALLVVAIVAGGVSRLGVRVPLGPYYRQLGLSVASSLVGAVLMGLSSLLYFLFLYASGEMIYLLLDIEQNTRETAYHLKSKL